MNLYLKSAQAGPVVNKIFDADPHVVMLANALVNKPINLKMRMRRGQVIVGNLFEVATIVYGQLVLVSGL